LFIGKQKLFKNYWIGKKENVPEDWWNKNTGAPVLRFEIPLFNNEVEYKSTLRDMIRCYYVGYELPQPSMESSLEVWIAQLIITLSTKLNKKVVILIDEYDAAINHCLDDPEACKTIEKISAQFYKGIKTATKCLRLLFVTGIMRYEHFSLFTGIISCKTLSYSCG